MLLVTCKYNLLRLCAPPYFGEKPMYALTELHQHQHPDHPKPQAANSRKGGVLEWRWVIWWCYWFSWMVSGTYKYNSLAISNLTHWRMPSQRAHLSTIRSRGTGAAGLHTQSQKITPRKKYIHLACIAQWGRVAEEKAIMERRDQ